MTATLSVVFLICFVFGLTTSMLSLLLGGAENLLGGDGVHGHIGPDGVSTGASGVDGLDGSGSSGHGGSAEMPFFSVTGMLMFLTWFGAMGFLLLRFSVFGTALILVLASGAGLIGATAIFLFYNKFLLAGETRLRPSDCYLPGTLARVTSGIRAGGTGEIVYQQGGARKTSGARSDEAQAHPQGQEVVIVRYEKGIAYVRALEK